MPYLIDRLRSNLAPFDTPIVRRWLTRLLIWGIISYGIRYVYFGAFYKASPFAQSMVSVTLIAQTILLYYFFAYVVFPRTVYKRRIGQLLLWLILWYGIIYQSNYWLFQWLHALGETSRVDREWKLLDTWGVWGFVTSSSAAFWTIFWSFPFVIFPLTWRVVLDVINLRTTTIQLEKDKLALELDFLKSQVNPHFLFNTLNSIYARIFDIDEPAGDLLLRLSELMRYNLYETNLPWVSLDKELAYIQNYLDLERNRLDGQPVLIEYTQTGEVDAYRIAPLLLIAFVENAFKHGVKRTSKPAYVRVSADMEANKLLFTVENSVPPKRQVAYDPIKKSGGVGLGNVRRRLDTLYRDRYELITLPAEAMYTVRISIQL
ncbi:sensor histidine kinase [uncultured Fibrella sp.]|uniref:sensor histidine kinase n=1 Tax=uncultured Fibrella sp. TaxID=1284596 RepID=UPI0035CC0675